MHDQQIYIFEFLLQLNACGLQGFLLLVCVLWPYQHVRSYIVSYLTIIAGQA